LAIELRAHLVDPEDGRIHVTHIFWGEDEAECRENMEAHAATCEKFGPALAHGDVIEEIIEIDDDQLPDPEDFEDEDDDG
jgi:hypothetical protein